MGDVDTALQNALIAHNAPSGGPLYAFGPGRIEGRALMLLPLMRALMRIMPPSGII